MIYPEHASDRRSAPDSFVYLDHAATTPMLPEAIAAMTEELAQLGNPSSLHNQGRRARRVVEESREQIAEAYGARPSEVVFTSGGTEADNLAVKGLFWARRDARPELRRVLATSAEHHAVLDSVRWLADHEGADPCWLPAGAAGGCGHHQGGTGQCWSVGLGGQIRGAPARAGPRARPPAGPAGDTAPN